MTLIERLPGMADDALGILHANAVRLGASGSASQRASAAALLPALEVEIAARSTAKRQGKAGSARKTAGSRKQG